MAHTSSRLASARSFLFVPADSGRRLASAWASSADAVVVDLEDAVPPEFKDAARHELSGRIPRGDLAGPLRVVRVNGHDTPWRAADLAWLSGADVDAIMVPKATPEALRALPAGGPPVIALIETARGLRASYEVATSPEVVALALGGADLGVELGWRPRPDNAELAHARAQLVLDSAAAGIRPPIDVVHLDTDATEALRDEATLAADLGLTGKLCIHPRQLDVVHEVMTPTAAEVDRARGIVAAWEAAAARNAAVTTLDGRLIDAPVAARARRTLALSHQLDPGLGIVTGASAP